MTASPEQLLLDLAERIRTRFYGKYRGTVTEVDAGTMRIRAIVPAVLGATPSGWAVACLPYAGPGVGLAFLPEVGAGVWIEFEGGDVSAPIWAGCFWREGEAPPLATPTAKAIVTAGGATLVMDDDARRIEISDGHGNSVVLSAEGIRLERGAQSVVLEPARVAVNDGALEVR